MTLINTNGMAFGPGSEWFWAALEFTALAITFIAIYRQFRIARSARAFEQVAAYTRQSLKRSGCTAIKSRSS